VKLIAMKRESLFVLLLATCFAVNVVDGLYTHRCKSAETSTDGFVRLAQNMNCTFREGARKFHEGLNNVLGFVSKGINKKTTTKPKNATHDGLDHAIDVRMITDETESRVKRQADEEVEGN